MNGKSGLNDMDGLRKVLPAAKDKVGAAARFYFPGLPAKSALAHIFSFCSVEPGFSQVSFIVDANGAIRVVRGRKTFQNFGDDDVASGTRGQLIATSDPIITANAWSHIECQAYIHDTLGWVRIAVDGVHRFAATGLDTKYDTTQVVSVAQHNTYIDNSDWYFRDYYVYDFTGTAATDTDWCCAVDGSGIATNYIGELDARYLPPDADTAEDDWTPSTGSDAYAMVNETTPNDASYIYSTAAGDLTELGLTDLPAEVTYIRGVDIWPRMSKSDGGVAMFKTGMKSVASTSDAAERPMTVAPTYWVDQINVDPNSAARWTRSSLNAAKLRLTRTV